MHQNRHAGVYTHTHTHRGYGDAIGTRDSGKWEQHRRSSAEEQLQRRCGKDGGTVLTPSSLRGTGWDPGRSGRLVLRETI